MPRVIPLLLHREGRIVLSREFSRHQDIGDALQIADRYKTWDLDELIYLDISSHWCTAPADELMRRFVTTVGEVARFCFVPLAVGGGVRSLADIDQLLHSGADRIVLNTMAFDRPELVREAARILGSQAIIASVDARRAANGEPVAFVDAGKRSTGKRAAEWARELEDLGAGEILINSIDRDGSGLGYDVELIESVVEAVSVPVIACGGAGRWSDFGALLRQANVSVAAANVFAFKELSYHAAKEAILADSAAIRPGILSRDYRAGKKSAAGSRLGADREQIWIDLAKGDVDRA